MLVPGDFEKQGLKKRGENEKKKKREAYCGRLQNDEIINQRSGDNMIFGGENFSSEWDR